MFVLAVADTETNSLASVLLNGDREGSCLYLDSEDNWVATLYLRVLDDVYENLVFTYTLTTSFRMYVDDDPIEFADSPVGSFTFTVTIEPCVLYSSDYDPKET